MDVRKVTARDRDEVLDILSHTMSQQYMPEMVDEFDLVEAGRRIGLVAQSDNHVVGYITCQRTTATYKIETLAVAPEHQRSGIGRRLVASIEDHVCNSTSERPIVVNVVTDDTSDDPVQAFYKRCGYAVSGIVTDEYRRGDRQVHLSKVIQ